MHKKNTSKDCDNRDNNNNKYQDLAREIQRIWKLRRVTLVPIIIGALGTVSKDIEKWLGVTGVTCRLESL